MNDKIAVIGLGYVGLPLALGFARHFHGTVGFDINAKRVEELKSGNDRNRETPEAELRSSKLHFTSNPEDLRQVTFFVVTVPTPIDEQKRPDLRPMISASELVARYLKKGDVVVFESTVYPGVTEEICGPVLAKTSGLKQGADFKLGYSPERINPGDHEHTLERIVKVIAAEDTPTLARVKAAYSAVTQAGVFPAASIKTAEAAKVIENTQRDLNIALMNELAIIFNRLGIRTQDVLNAAGTKWNFIKFRPGLVGGHCIGVDPYYLTAKAEETGYHPEVILAGRRINDSMGAYVAERVIKLLIQNEVPIKKAKVAILGMTFKENVRDIRNSRVPDIEKELRNFGLSPLSHDPIADPQEIHHEYGLTLCGDKQLEKLDAVIFAVSHKEYLEKPEEMIFSSLRPGGIIFDVKSALNPSAIPSGLIYSSL